MTELDRIRTDVVGSLLRPAAWKDARARMEQGSISESDFAQIELECVRKHVALQESIGLDVLTDGVHFRGQFSVFARQLVRGHA